MQVRRSMENNISHELDWGQELDDFGIVSAEQALDWGFSGL